MLGRLLIVDDDDFIGELIATHLGDLFKIEHQKDGLSGLRSALKEAPAFIISDVRMPQLSGINLLKQLRENPQTASVPLILLSAMDQDEDRIRGYENLCDLYMTKPFNVKELRVAILGILKNRQRIRDGLQVMEPDQALDQTITDEDRKLLERIEAAVESRVSDSSLTVNDVAKAVFLSRRQLERRLLKIKGVTPAQYIRSKRLEVAKRMVDSGRITCIKLLADWVGFNDQRTFVRRFKEYFGHPPRVRTPNNSIIS